MAKKIIQDIYINKKSIRLIKKSRSNVKHEEIRENNKKDEHIEKKRTLEKVSNNSHFFLWGLCIVFVALVLFLLSSTFSTATITITPKIQTLVLDDTFNITTDTTNTKNLHFQIMTVKKTASKSLETDGEQYVELKAMGKVIIYNNDSTSKQRLINNTRLSTPDGLIYRIRNSVDVPGTKVVSGVKTPGSVEVDVIADVAGDKYNMSISDLKGDFKIPGFKDSTKYNTFYARLSSDITGGFIGNQKKVSQDNIIAGRNELINSLKTDIVKDIYTQTPEQFLVFKDNYFTQINDLPGVSKNSSYEISEEVIAYVVMFNKVELSNYLAKIKIKDFDNSKVDILWSDAISASTTGSTAKPWTEKTLKIKLTGQTRFVWVYDPKEILSAIKGQSRDILQILLKQTPPIKEIQASIRPQWNSTFPKNENKIKIVDSIRDINQ
jgi:hypothetical protein